MIFLIVADNKTFRQEKLATVLEPLGESEIITLDDTTASLSDLEEYLYPSLFISEPPIVHGRFVASASPEPSVVLVKKFLSSPTIFIFEEIMLPKGSLQVFKKAGAIIHALEKKASAIKKSDVFKVATAITASDKKTRWLTYREALEDQPIEALLGILYWKVRTLAAKGSPGNVYEKLYGNMLRAHAKAWESGAPLELLIEKEILTF